MLKLLGFLDLVAAGVLIILRFITLDFFAWGIVILLIIKSLLFIKSYASIVDLIGSLFFILAILGHYYMLTWIFVVWFLQKAFVSLTA